jgi:hypothetical protein
LNLAAAAVGSARKKNGKEKKNQKNIAHTFAATGLSSYIFFPSSPQATRHRRRQPICLPSPWVLAIIFSSRSILCFWTLSFFSFSCQRVVDSVFFLPPLV